MRRVIGEAHRVQRWRVVGLGHPRTNLLAPPRTRTTAISEPKHRAVGTGPEAVKGRWKAAVSRFFRLPANVFEFLGEPGKNRTCDRLIKSHRRAQDQFRPSWRRSGWLS